jgi:glycine/sarcosine N-methyltransferase
VLDRLLRAELDAALGAAGFTHLRWHEPDRSGFHQPIVTARR